MTSARQIAANRRNAQRSTGPRSRAGRARSSRNALKHGLAITLTHDPEMAEEVSALAAAIAGEARGDATLLAFAGTIAEAELDLIRVRMARVQLLNGLAADPKTFVPKLPPGWTPDLIELALGPAPPDDLMSKLVQSVVSRMIAPVETVPEKQALVLACAAPQLLTFDRYERRAMSRRKTAFRAFETARLEGARMSPEPEPTPK